MTELVLAAFLGFAAGGLSGMFGVGGGILFVPTLVLVLDLSQLEGQATSLAAMIPVVAVGAWRQHRYGNVRWRSAAVIGVLSIGGVAAGTVLATSLSDDVLRKLFASLLVLVAIQLMRSAGRPGTPLPGP
ncbi:MAG TPA: sulfite exporter TauE/SafE family protein [Gaiellaceae bacterium]|nr:sulfite exporter TauE/SafE family protein [Gaiellaceae bacterium]